MTDFVTKIAYKVDSSDLKKARGEVSKTNKGLKESEQQAGRSGKAFSKTFGFAANVAVKAAKAAAALALAVQSVTAKILIANQAINDAALFTGESAERLSALAGALSTVGVGFEETAQLINSVNERVNEAVEGSAEFADLFTNIGLSAAELEKRSPAQVLEDIIIAINNIEDPSLRARAINQFLGDTGVQVLKLASSEEELIKVQARAITQGVAVGEQQRELANRFDAAKNSITSSLQALANNLVTLFTGQDTVGAVEDFADLFEENLVDIVVFFETFGDIIDDTKDKIGELLDSLPKTGDLTGFNALINAAGLGEGSAFDNLVPEDQRDIRATDDFGAGKVDDEGNIAQIEDARINSFEDFLALVEEEGIIRARVTTQMERGREAEAKFAKRFQELTEDRIRQERQITLEQGKQNAELKLKESLNDKAAEDLRKLVDAEEKAAALIQSINAQTNLQLEAREQLLAGNITSQAELSEFMRNELEVQRLINEAKKDGLDITEEEIRGELEKRREAEEGNRQIIRRAEALREIRENLVQGLGDELGDQLSEGLRRGELNFREFAANVVEILLRSGIDSAIQGLLNPQSGAGGGIGSFFASLFGGEQADGGAFNRGVQFFAQGGVVNSTTPFGMSGGKFGVMGEAGPEAILPLSRGPSGDLGVKAEVSGGGNTVVNEFNVSVSTNSDQPEQVGQETAKALEVMVRNAVRNTISDEQRSGNLLNRGL